MTAYPTNLTDHPRYPDHSAPGIRPIPTLLLAIAWSWIGWAGAIAFGGVETAAGGIAWIVGGLGPAVAVAVALKRSSPAYRQSFRRRLLRWRVGATWLAVAVALTVGPKVVALLAAAVAGHEVTGESISLSAVPISLVLGVIVVWIEEPLWRGVALDGFRGSPARASLTIGAFWAVWHWPLFAVDGTFQHDLGLLTADFWIFSAGVLGLAVFMTWLVLGSGGSIFLAMVAHLLVNATGEFLPDDTTIRVMEMGIIWVLAAALAYRLWLRSDATVQPPRGALAR